MRILFEDYYLLAIDKPAGLSTENGHEAHPSAESEALAYFSHQLAIKSRAPKAPPYLRAAHRLDRPASGVLLFAKTKTALTAVMNQFEQGLSEKTYWAVVEKCPPGQSGRLVNWIARDPSGKKALIHERQVPGSQTCLLEYEVKQPLSEGFLLEIRPLTGRFHQIRAQMAYIGCPIVGDSMYGAAHWKNDQIKLHACRLALKHPKSSAPLVLESRPEWLV